MDTEEAILHETSVEDDAKSIEEVRRDIYHAVMMGNFDVSKNFTVEGKDVLLMVSSTGNTVLHVAAKYGKNDVAQARQIIEKYPSLLYKTNKKGNTPLHIAASLGHLDMTKFLLERAKDQQDIEANTPLIKMVNLEKDTALHAAVRNGCDQIVDLLIAEDGGLTSLTNNAGESPLFMAVDGEFDEIADSILKIPNCSYRGRKGMNVLHAAVIRKDNKETPPGNPFKIICNYALSSLRQSCCNRTYEPIHKLEDSESESTVRLEGMLNKFRDAMVEADDEFGWIPLHYAAYFGDVEVVELFLDKNISLAYKTDREGMSALHISAKKGHTEVVKKLIKKCPDTCELLDNRDRTVLHIATESGRGYLVATFLETENFFQDLLNEQDKDGNTPFHLAAIKKHYSLLMDMADQMEFASMAMNKEGMSTYDIIQSDNTLTSEKKFEILNKLNAEKSLERVVHIRTTKKQTVETSAQVQTGQSNQEIAEEEEEEEELVVFRDGKDGDAQVGTDESSQKQLKNMFDTNILVATLVATVTFAAAFQVPGGYDDNGQAILSQNISFLGFMIFDSLALGFSAASIFIHFFASYAPKLNKLIYPELLVLILNEIGILFALGAFLFGTHAVLAEKPSLATAIVYCVLGSFLLSILGIPINIGWWCIRFISKWLRFYHLT